jgi:biopolymer transport protein ExbB
MEWIAWTIDYGISGALIAISIIALAIAVEQWHFLRGGSVDAYANRQEVELHLTRRLHIIATGSEGIIDTGKIMTGLALKATAVDLLVAILDVVFYNLLLRRAKEEILQWESAHGRK